MAQLTHLARAQQPALIRRLLAGARRALPRIAKRQQSMSEPPEAHDEAALAALVDHYQRLVASLTSATDSDQREALREAVRAQLEALWPALESLVEPLAWSWVRRHLSDLGGSRGHRDAHQGVTTSMCMHILDSLATHPIPTTLPVRPLLRRIARNRMIDEYRHSRRHSPDQPAPSGPPSPAPQTATFPLSLDEAALRDYPALSVDIAVQLDDRLFRDEILAAIGQYWQLRLSPDETRIVQARMTDPPTPYDTIAVLFLPPWSPGAVRQRYSRIIADTRAHLRAIGLLPNPEADN